MAGNSKWLSDNPRARLPVIELARDPCRSRSSGEGGLNHMFETGSVVALLGGRLAIDFANAPSYPGAPFHALSWEELILFLESARIVSPERGVTLIALSEADPQTAHALLSRATRLRDALREAFGATMRNEHLARERVEPINEVLRITAGDGGSLT